MAQQLDFTNRHIDGIEPPSTGRAEYRDTKVQGLYLRVTSKGVKTFSFVGRAKGSHRVERLTLGKYPGVKPEEARTRAKELAGKLAGGHSVASAAREKKGELTVEELWKLYYAYIKARNRDPESTELVWTTYVQPKWGRRRLSEVSAVDVQRWHSAMPAEIMARRATKAAAAKAKAAVRRKEIEARQAVRRHGPDPKPKPLAPAPVSKVVTGQGSANRSLELLRAVYNWGSHATRGYYSGANPAAKHEPFALKSRDRFLHPDELGAFFTALAQEPSEAMRDAILLGLLTGQRRANFIGMRWADLNLDRAEWTIPGELMKNNEPHVVPLVPEAVAILQRRKEGATSLWVFPSDRSKSGHIGEPRKAWRRLLGSANLKDLIVHDLRRTLGSWQARTGASLVMIGKSLNHLSPEATAIYARLDIDPVRGAFNTATSAMFAAAGVKPTAQVIAMPEKAEKAEVAPKHGSNAA